MANKKVSQLTSKPSVLVTDLFPIADPSTGQLYKTTISDLGTAIGSGVSSVNTLVGAVVLDTDDIQELVSPTNKWFTDTRARAALSASSPLAYNSGTGVFSISAATSSQNGYLTSADWTTFNAKQAALSGTGFVKISGTTISYDNSSYALDSAVVKLTGTQTIAGIKTFSNQPVFNSSFIIKNSGSGSVSYGGNTTIWTSDDSYNILVGTAASTSRGFTLLYSSINPILTLPSSDGTLALTSQLSSYLPLSGGTLTGALSGTSVSLSSSVTTSGVYLTGMTSGSGALYYNSGANRVTVANYNASGIVVFEVGGGATALTLNSNLSASFASTLSATIGTFSNYISVGGTSGLTSYGTINIPTGEKMILNSYHGLELKTSGGVGSTTPISIFNISSGGAATFSSSVTATNLSINTTTTDGRIDVRPNALSSFPIYWRNNNGGYGGGVYVTGGNNMQMYLANSAGTENVIIAASGVSWLNGGGLYINQTTNDPAAALANFQLTQNYNNWIHQVRNSATTGGSYGCNIVFSVAPNNTASAFFAGSDSSAERYRMYANGGLANYQSNNVNLSDERTKKEISPLESYWNKFKALEIVKFKYKDQTHDDFNIGVIAQQVESVAPEFVDVDGWGETKNDEAPLKSIYTADLYHASIGVLKEAMAKIETLEAEIQTLKNK
jgi:hypothetical protein